MTDQPDTQPEPLPGFTLVEVHMRMFLDEDGDIDHETLVERPEGNLPPLYAVLGAWELAKDTIKDEYREPYDCGDPACEECYDFGEDDDDPQD